MANKLFTTALKGEAQRVPPIWMMRQAGRYHRHYQQLRAKYSFMELCKIPEVAAQVALGPISDFDFDVSIMFSDLLFPLEALGMGLKYEPGPILDRPLTLDRLKELRPPGEAWPHLEFQRHVLQATRALLPKEKSLIGFIGGPWTLFTYAVEGAHKGSLIHAKSHADLFHRFNALLIPVLQKNIDLQLEGGAEIVMIFDTAAGELAPFVFQKWCVPVLQSLAQMFPGRLGYYSKHTQGPHLQQMRASGIWAGFGFDHGWSLPEVLKENNKGFVQGNFDQALLFMSPPEMRTYLTEYLKPLLDLGPDGRRGWVCGLGHGVLPATPEANVRTFVSLVRECLA